MPAQLISIFLCNSLLQAFNFRVDELNDFTAFHINEMIVMGTHGRTGLARVVLGNVAYGVLRSADVPVLAMRHPEREWLT